LLGEELPGDQGLDLLPPEDVLKRLQEEVAVVVRWERARRAFPREVTGKRVLGNGMRRGLGMADTAPL
jgi:hypothetical protein